MDFDMNALPWNGSKLIEAPADFNSGVPTTSYAEGEGGRVIGWDALTWK